MANNVDNRIVNMKFNNAAFERGAAATMATIRKLKDALKFDGASKGLKDIERSADNVSFAGMAKALDTISNRFSTFGIIGAAALQKITHTAIETGARIASAITDPLVEGGKRRALNIEQAKFQFEGLGIDVEKAMASALEAVSGTAYGLDAAAKVASQFGASGMVAGAEMTQSLRAVSGVAAMTGSDYEDIGNIFVQVAGQGRLMGDQLLQLSGRGINAAATLANSLGKTEKEIREMVSDGKISFEVFYKAMDEAFGAHAKDANKTFTGALANMKAALSRIGADVATPAFRSLRNVFNSLTPVIDNVHAALGPLTNSIIRTMKAAERMTKSFLKGIKEEDLTNIGKGLNKLYKAAANVFNAISSVIKPIKAGLKEALPPATTEGFLNFAKSLKRVTEQLKVTKSAAEGLKNVGRGLGNIFSSVTNVFKAVLSFIKPVKEAIVESIEPFKDSVKNLLPDSLTKAFVDVTGNLKKFTEGLILTDEQSEKVKTVFKGLFTVIGNMLKPISSIAGLLLKALNPAFKLLGVIIGKLVSIMGSIVDTTITLLSAGINPLSKAIEFLAPIVAVLFNKFKEAVIKTKLFQTALAKVKEVVSKVSDTFTKSGSGIKGFTEAMKLVGSVVKNIALSSFKKLVEYMPIVTKIIKEVGSKFEESAKMIAAGFKEMLGNAGNNISSLMDSAGKALKTGLDYFSVLISKAGNEIRDFLANLPKSMAEIGPWVAEMFKGAASSIDIVLATVITTVGTFIGDILVMFGEIGSSLVPIVLSGIKKVASAFSIGLQISIETAMKFVSDIIELFREIGPGIIEALGNGISNAGYVVSAALQYIIESVIYFIADIVELSVEIAPALIKGITTGFRTMGNKVREFLTGIINDISKFSEEVKVEAAKIGAAIGEGISSGLTNASEETSKNLENIIIKVKEFSKSVVEGLQSGIQKITEFITALGHSIRDIAKAFKDAALEKISPVLSDLADKFSFITIPIKKASQAIKSAFDSMEQRVELAKLRFLLFYNAVKTVFNKIVTFLKPVADKISALFEGMTIGDIINTASLVGLVKVFSKLTNSLGGISKSFKDFIGSASNTLNAVKESLEGYQKSLKASTLKEIAIAVAILAGSIVLLSTIKGEKLAAGLGAVTVLLGEVIATLKILDKMDLDTKGINKAAISMDIIAVSIGLLAGALKKLEGFDSMKSIAPALLGVSTLLTELTAAIVVLMKTMDKIDSDTMGGDLIKVSIAMIAISSAVSKLATACQKLGSMDTGQLIQGAGAIGTLLAALVLFAALNKGKELDNIAGVILAISVSMLLLQKAVEKLGSMDFGVMASGLLRVVALMGTLVIGMKLMDGINMKGTASSILAMATALNLLIIPIKVFGSMDLTALAKGLIAVGIAMAEMALAVNAMPSGGVKGAGAMIAMATALTILAVPIKVLGSMDLKSLVTGLTAVAVALGGMAAIMVILSPLGASLIMVAGAFALFGGAITLVGAGVALFAVGLTTLAASVTLCVAGLMTFLAALPMIAAELNIALQAIAALAPGIGASLQVIGDTVIQTVAHWLTTIANNVVEFLANLVTKIAAEAPKFVDAGVKIFNEFLKGIQKVIPNIIKTGVTAVTEFLKGIQKTIPEIVKTGVTLIKNLLKGVQQTIGDIVQTGVTIVRSVLKGVQQVSGDIVQTGVKLIKDFLKGVREVFPDVIETGLELIKDFLKGVRKNIKEIVQTGIDIVTNFIDGVASKIGDVIDSAMNLAISFIEGLADAIDKNGDRMIAAVEKLFTSVINFLIKFIKDAVPKIFNKAIELGKAIINGIAEIIPKLPKLALQLVLKIAKGVIEAKEEMKKAAKDLVNGLLKGLADGFNKVKEGAKKLGKAAVDSIKGFLGIHSPSTVFAAIGEFCVKGFVNGLTTQTKKSSGKIVDVVKMMMQPFTKTLNQVIKTMDYGKGVVQAFYKNFVKGTKDLQAGNKAMVNMANAVQNFAYQLYLASDVYKDDMANQKARAKEYEKALKAREKAEKAVAKAAKKSAESSKKAAKASANAAKSAKKTGDTASKAAEKSAKATDKATKSVKEYDNAMKGAVKSSEKVLTAKEQFALDQKTGTGDDDDEDGKKKKKSSSSKSSSKSAATKAKNQAKKDKTELKNAQKELKEAQKNVEKIDKAIQKEAQTVAKHIKQVFNELRNSLAEGVREFLEPLSISLDSGIDIFSEFNKEYSLTSQELLANMKSQVEGVQKWNADLATLAKRGLDEGLIQTLREMGPQSAEQIHAFMQMTTDELNQANDSWLKANKLTADTVLRNQEEALKAAQEWADGITELAERGLNQELLKKLGEAGVGSSEYVKAYLSMTPEQINEMNEYYKKYLKIPETISDEIIAAYVVAGDESLKGFVDGATGKKSGKGTKKTNAKKEIEDGLVHNLEVASKEAGKVARAEGIHISKNMAEGMEEGGKSVTKSADRISKSALDKFETRLTEDRGKTITSKFAEGIATGFKIYTGEIFKTSEEAVEAITKLQETVSESLSSVSNSISSALSPTSLSYSTGIDIFSEFNKEYELTSKDLLKNMNDQVVGVLEWNADLKALMAKGLDEGLIQTLKDAGPQSAEQVHAFMQMTIEELNQANTSWRVANQMTAQALLDSQKEALENTRKWKDGILELAERGLDKGLLQKLSEAGVGSAEYVKTFLEMTPKQIEEMNSMYEESLSLPEEVSRAVVETYNKAGLDAMDAFEAGLKVAAEDATTEVVYTATGLMTELSGAALREALEGGTEAGTGLSNGISTGINESKETTINTALSLARATRDAMSTHLNEEQGKRIAEFLSKGVATGIQAQTQPMGNAVKLAADIASKEVNESVQVGMSTIGENAVSSYTQKVTSIGEPNSPEKKEIKETYVAVTEEIGTATSKEAKLQGENTVTAVANGALSKESTVRNAFLQIGRAALTSMKSFLNQGVGIDLATDIIEGVIIGFQTNESRITQEAQAVALKALQAAKAALGIASPSKEFIKVGKFSAEGIILGLKAMERNVADSGREVGTTLLDTVKLAAKKATMALNDDILEGPTITPVIDLSEVTKASRKIDTTFSKSLSMKLAAETDINANLHRGNINVKADKDSKEPVSNSYSFVQNNYSPKELSRIDIYRNTRSQFSQFKREVEGA